MLRDEDVGLSLAVRLGKAGACELAAWCMASHDYAFREAVPQELCLTVMEGETDAQRSRSGWWVSVLPCSRRVFWLVVANRAVRLGAAQASSAAGADGVRRAQGAGPVEGGGVG